MQPERKPQKKKKKSKKRVRQETSTSEPKSQKEESTLSEQDGINLEGHMIGDEMVLIDRSSGKVYSALETTENGSRRQVGRLVSSSNEGERVDLFPSDNPSTAGKQPVVGSFKRMLHVSKPVEILFLYGPSLVKYRARKRKIIGEERLSK